MPYDCVIVLFLFVLFLTYSSPKIIDFYNCYSLLSLYLSLFYLFTSKILISEEKKLFFFKLLYFCCSKNVYICVISPSLCFSLSFFFLQINNKVIFFVVSQSSRSRLLFASSLESYLNKIERESEWEEKISWCEIICVKLDCNLEKKWYTKECCFIFNIILYFGVELLQEKKKKKTRSNLFRNIFVNFLSLKKLLKKSTRGHKKQKKKQKQKRTLLNWCRQFNKKIYNNRKIFI